MSIDARVFNARRREISREDLLAEIRIVAEHPEVEGTPSSTEMKLFGEYSPSVYRDRFGTWNEAVHAAGFTPNQPGSGKAATSENELLDALREYADHLGRTPTMAEANNDGPFTGATYANRFGSWNNALREAGLEINEEWEGTGR